MSRPSAQALYDTAAALQAGDAKAAIAARNREEEQNKATDDPVQAAWDAHNGERSESIIRFILQRTPKLLADCPPNILEPLRVAAAMMELWGTSSIRDYVTIEGEISYRFDALAIALMLSSHGHFLYRLEEMRRIGITRVQLIGSGWKEDCRACRAADGKKFNIDDVPELPLANCRCKTGYGCRVVVGAVEAD